MLLRFNLFLLMLVMASAFYLVHTQYESRRLYTQLDRANTLARRLEADHEQWVVQKRGEATSARIQSIATDKLHMRPANPAITFYVSDARATPEAALAPAALPSPPVAPQAKGAQR